MTPGIGLLLEVGLDILKTSKTNAQSFITAQIGNVVTGIATGDVSEWWQHVGFASRPKKPTAGTSAAQCVVIKKSDHDAVIASRDSRTAAVYDSLLDGETAIFASEGGAIIILRVDGTIEITGGTVKIGDSSAQALAYGAKFEALCDALATVIATNCVNGSPLVGNATFQNSITSIKANSKTTKALGT